MATSAQYYVNPKGVSIQEGCQWGDGSRPIGNFAPINLGVGKKDGATFISIFQNKPTTNAKLDFKIEIKGDNLSGKCRYENGLFYGATGSNSDGCTVSFPPFPEFLFMLLSRAPPPSPNLKPKSKSWRNIYYMLNFPTLTT